ncbi:MAG: hypothetical protein D6706_18505 [Chloroflexi bacterium]|nr:MAG: hypothetical protein D6706_18505 [Chloroflexota bacterium]
MNPVEFLFRAFRPPELDIPPQPCAAICSMSGAQITEGYPISAVVSKATADIADTFRGKGDWLSVEAARLFKASSLMRGNLLALPDEGLQPTVGKEYAQKTGRPTWEDLITNLPIGTPTIAIFMDEAKRRLWPAAPLSEIGPHWSVLINRGGVVRRLTLDIHALRECLDYVRSVYDLGFSKQAIQNSLFHNFNVIDQVGVFTVVEMETNLSYWRTKDEFIVTLFVVQKGG